MTLHADMHGLLTSEIRGNPQRTRALRMAFEFAVNAIDHINDDELRKIAREAIQLAYDACVVAFSDRAS